MAFERTQTKHRAPIPKPGEESVIHGDTQTAKSKREGFVSGALKRIQRFRKERAAAKAAEAKKKRDAEAKKEAARKAKEVTREKTEGAIKSRRQKQQEQLKDLGI